MIHGLKEHPVYFEEVIAGRKTFEVRRDDRHFAVGDYLALNEYITGEYSGRSCLVYVDHILDDPEYVKEGYVVMSIKPCIVHRATSPYSPSKGALDYSVPLTEGRAAE